MMAGTTKTKTWPRFPPPTVGNSPSGPKTTHHVFETRLCSTHLKEMKSRVAQQHATVLDTGHIYPTFDQPCPWRGCEHGNGSRLIHVAVTAPPDTLHDLGEVVQADITTSEVDGYTPCRLPTAEFMARARSLAGTTTVLSDAMCNVYAQPAARALDRLFLCHVDALEFTMREAVLLTADPLAKLREVVADLPGAGPVPLVVPVLLGDEGALFGDDARVVIVKGLAALTPEWPGDRVTLSDMAAADVVVFPLPVAEALCGPQKRVFDLKALPWRDGVMLVRYATCRFLGRWGGCESDVRCRALRRLKRFQCAMFWQVVQEAMWPALSPVYSRAVYRQRSKRKDVYQDNDTHRAWMRHFANHD